MKTERVTLLTTKEFKSFLRAEARREGISVAQLVRVRCEQKPNPGEAVLANLTAELHKALTEAKDSLRDGIKDAQSALADLRSNRVGTPPPGRRRLSRHPAK